MVGPKKQDFCMWWLGFKNFILFLEMEEHGASEALSYEFGGLPTRAGLL